MENPVKLGEAGEAAGGRNIGYLVFRIQQQELAVADPDQVDILGNCIAGDLPELVGEVKGIHVNAFRKPFQSEVIHIMGMDVVGYGVDTFRKAVLRILCLINIVIVESFQIIQELGKKAVYHEFIGTCHFLGSGLTGQRHDFIENPHQNLLLGFRKTENGYRIMKGSQEIFVGIFEPIAIVALHKGDDQPLGGCFTGIKGFVQTGRLQKNEIVGPDSVGDSFDEMCGYRA